MMRKCMTKKTKQQSAFMGVLTRSKALALQKFQRERPQFLQLGTRMLKKKQRRADDSCNLSKGKMNRGLKLEEGFDREQVKDDLCSFKDDLGSFTLVGASIGTAAISAQGSQLGGDFILADNVLVTGGNNRVTRECTPEHLIIRSDYIRTPCSSTKGSKAVADERYQTEVGGNSHQRKKLTTDLLLQENSNYAPSMEKYNFDFENDNPLPGRYEWEKVQP